MCQLSMFGVAIYVQVEEDPDERDAETRVAAVKALAAVAQKLFAAIAHQAQNAKSDQDKTQAAAAVQDHVIKPLLTAMEDYSTDNRSVKHWSGQPETAAKSVYDHNDRLLW